MTHIMLRTLIGTLAMAALPLCAFDLQGHRGARGLAPENTLAAFAKALDVGVTTLELDIAITADGVPVISHDPALHPALTRDAQGEWLAHRGPLIKALPVIQLQNYDVGRVDPASAYGRQFAMQRPSDGERIPTLAALFKLVNDRGAAAIRFNIETKVFPTRPDETLAHEAFVRILLAAIGEAGMTRRVVIQSFDWRTLQVVQKLEPAIPTAYLTVQSQSNDTLRDGTWTAGMLLRDHASIAQMVKAAGGSIWSPNFNDLTADAVKEARRLGLRVIPWTVNELPDIARLLAWDVDGIISDYPDRVRDVMRQRGMPLPNSYPR